MQKQILVTLALVALTLVAQDTKASCLPPPQLVYCPAEGEAFGDTCYFGEATRDQENQISMNNIQLIVGDNPTGAQVGGQLEIFYGDEFKDVHFDSGPNHILCSQDNAVVYGTSINDEGILNATFGPRVDVERAISLFIGEADCGEVFEDTENDGSCDDNPGCSTTPGTVPFFALLFIVLRYRHSRD